MCLSVGGCVVFVFNGTDYAEDQDNYNDNNNEDNGERNHYCYMVIAFTDGSTGDVVSGELVVTGGTVV